MWYVPLLIIVMVVVSIAVLVYPFLKKEPESVREARAAVNRIRLRRKEIYENVVTLDKPSASTSDQKRITELKEEAAALVIEENKYRAELDSEENA